MPPTGPCAADRARRSARLCAVRSDEIVGAVAVPADEVSDEELIRRARATSGAAASELLDQLFRRHQTRVAAWCLRLSGRRDEAADLAQEVFLRVYERLDGFRFESRFSTWLYLVVRSVTINRGQFESRRRAMSLEDEGVIEPIDPAPTVDGELIRDEQVGRLRAAMAETLEPLEAKVVKLHHVDGLTLAAIDRLLGLTNRSGARAYLVSAKRKLRRRLVEEGV